MAKIKGKGKDYSPIELLRLLVRGTWSKTSKKMLSPVDMGKKKKEWRDLPEQVKKDTLDKLLWDSLSGVGGQVKLSGPLKKSASTIGHILSDKSKKKFAKELGNPSLDIDVVGKKLVESMADSVGTEKGFMNRLRSMFIGTAPLSPETIYALEKSGAGRKIYRTIDLADQSMNKFMSREFADFQKALGKIEPGSVSSRRVGQVLDGKLPVEQLKGQEVVLHKFLKERFDFLINQYGKNTLGDDKLYKKIAHAASADPGKKPMIGVKDLSKRLKNEYDLVVGRIARQIGKKSVKSMSSKEKELLKRYGEVLKKIRHKGWVEKLQPKEREIYSLLSRKIKNYLPHIFDRDELMKGFVIEQEILEKSLRLSTDTKEITKIKKRLVSIGNSINKLKGGDLVTYEHLPQNIRFKFFDARKGAKGYSFDAAKAYESYLSGMSEKLYQDPALKKVGVLYKDLDPVMRRYTKQHVKDWLGMGRTNAMELANVVTTTQWMLKLGMNPRSAITNAAQRVNTLAEVGEKNAIKGYFKGWTKEGTELFDRTGLAQEVPTVLLEGQVPKKMAWMKDKLGWMFTKMEIGNRKHAFLSGIEQGKQMGLTGDALTQHGIDVVHKTQFRYGSVGMPAPLRTAPGKVMFQFWSYPIKQMEFLAKLFKSDPMKLAKWILYAEGGRQLLKRKAGVDLGNALGLGLVYSEVKKSMEAMSDGEIESAFRHAKLSVQGGGIVPGLSPTPSALLKIGEGFDKGLVEGGKAIGKEITPVQVGKMWKGYQGIKGRQEINGEIKYPWKDTHGAVDEYLTPWELGSEVLGPKTVTMKNISEQKSEDFSYKKLKNTVEQEARDLYTKGEPEDIIKAIKLLGSIGTQPTGEQAESGIIRKTFPYKVRRELDKTDQDRIIRLLNP